MALLNLTPLESSLDKKDAQPEDSEATKTKEASRRNMRKMHEFMPDAISAASGVVKTGILNGCGSNRWSPKLAVPKSHPAAMQPCATRSADHGDFVVE
jgi:hypothetical protein